jgi:predicted SpoU family rRNA methylase
MPLIYAGIGGFAIVLAYLDPQGPEAALAIGIAAISEVAALTVFLRRQDYRALSREYTGETIDLPSRLDG